MSSLIIFVAGGDDKYAEDNAGFHDSGPKDIGHEIHAKMEEAAQHALSIINGAMKFTDEAEKEQSAKYDPAGALKDDMEVDQPPLKSMEEH